MTDYETFANKFEKSVHENLERENVNRIINFLVKQKCDYIEDLIEDYLDLFTITYEEFVNKYNRLNKKHNGMFMKKASDDMNIFEEFYY